MNNMGPTYSLREITERLPLLNTEELLLMKSLIDEEAEYYTPVARVTLYRYLLLFYKIQCRREQIKLAAHVSDRINILREIMSKHFHDGAADFL